MVCRHCPKTPRRTAPLAFLLLPLVASLLMARALSKDARDSNTTTSTAASLTAPYTTLPTPSAAAAPPQANRYDVGNSSSSSSSSNPFQTYYSNHLTLPELRPDESSDINNQTDNKSNPQNSQSLLQSYNTGVKNSSNVTKVKVKVKSSRSSSSSTSSTSTSKKKSFLLDTHNPHESFPFTTITTPTTTTSSFTSPTTTYTSSLLKPAVSRSSSNRTTTQRYFVDLEAHAVKSGRLEKQKEARQKSKEGGKEEEEEVLEKEQEKGKSNRVEEMVSGTGESRKENPFLFVHQMHHHHHQCSRVPILFEENVVPKKKPKVKCQTCERPFGSNCSNSAADEHCLSLPRFLCEEKNFSEEDLLSRRLTYCPHMSLRSVMCESQLQGLRTEKSCEGVARHLTERDEMVGRLIQQHADLIMKYNCEYNYSVTQNCTGCKEAYRYWVCSQFFPVYLKGSIVKPCRQFCHEVERKCPYLLPKDKPVAGEPSFLCQDPDISELEDQESSYGPDNCCYRMCPNEEAPGYTPVEESSSHLQHHPTLCFTFPTAATNSSLLTTASSGSSNSSTSGGGEVSLETMDNSGDSQCLSTHGADSCLCHSTPSRVAPLSSSSCTVISRKHCWTRTALYILLLCLVRTRALMPRGFT